MNDHSSDALPLMHVAAVERHEPHAAAAAGSIIYKTPSGRPVIQVGFWGPEDGPTHETLCFNSLAACWTKTKGRAVSFTHCEIRFANTYVCSIHEYMRVDGPGDWSKRATVPGTVHCVPRELDRRNYQFIDVPVTRQQHDVMFLKAMEYSEKRIPFNQAGMRLNFVWPFSWAPVDRREEAFFCSELVVTLFQKAGMLMHIRACTTSANELYDVINESLITGISYNRNTGADQRLGSLSIPEL